MSEILSNDTQIVILAGGKGTRLSSINKGLPKSLTPLLSVPIIEHQIRFCKSQGFNNFLLVLCYKSKLIKDYFKKNPVTGVTLNYYVEDKARGTGGALFSCLDLLEEFFFVVYSDTFFTIDFSKFLDEFNKKLKYEKDTQGMILVHPNNHPHDSDLVELDENKQLIALHGYPHKSNLDLRNLVNAAFYIFKKDLLRNSIENFEKISNIDIAKDIFPLAVKRRHKIFGLNSSEYIKDMGTPERLNFLENMIHSGKLKNLSPGVSKEVVFIDRDGCINKEKGLITKMNNLELINGSAEGIKLFNESALPVFCITNQPVIARGDITETELNSIHSKLDLLLGEKGAFLDSLYYCPHHPNRGFKGEIKKYKINCDCRKPNSGLLFQAAKDHNINLSRSWFIGDSTTDIAAANNVGVKSILVKTGYGGSDLKVKTKPDYIFKDVFEASYWITNDYKLMREKVIKIINQIVKQKIILVSGLNHSGKSNFCQVMKESIEGLGFNCHLINTDSWCTQSPISSKLSNIHNNYDLKTINKFIESFLDEKFPIYHNHLIKLSNFVQINDVCEVLYPNSILILEGPPLVNLFEKYKNKALRIFISNDQNQRLKNIEKNLHLYKMFYKNKNALHKDIIKNDLKLINNFINNSDFEIKLNC